MKIAAITDIGSCRQENQDNYCAQQLAGGTAWGIVCDGMGGARGGREASQCACSVIERCFQEQYNQCIPGEEETFLKKALLSANRYVFQKALREESLAGMGTTAVCALVRGGKAYLSHAGDSRAYLYRDGKLAQLTHDHSYVQELVDCGTITQEQAEHHPQKNIITRALGVDYRLEPEVTSVQLQAKDLLLLCSDGLTNAVREAARGGSIIAPDVASKVLQMFSRMAQGDVQVRVNKKNALELTKMEWQVIREVGCGLSNKEIAGRLYLSEGTVRNYISSILRKLELRDRTQLAIWAVQNQNSQPEADA